MDSYIGNLINQVNDINQSLCLGACKPIQIVTLEMPVNEISQIKILDDCNQEYKNLQWSYSLDGVCWSCYMSFDDVISNTLNDISDYFVRAKVPGEISSVTIDGGDANYSTSLDSSFSLDSNCSYSNYSPYTGLDGALQLQQALSNMVACTVGIPIYYFKIDGTKGAADLTFKEYALYHVSSVKQIKLIIADGQMPSSRPEFTDIGLDWQTDWETEIMKSDFATAFGPTAQPQDGDFIYIPMMKRMWMVNESYDEKNGSLMWQSTTFKVMLVKYQQDGSTDLGDVSDFVNDLVTNKYDDLFGKNERNNQDAGYSSVNVSSSRRAGLYPVFRSDATRKEMTCEKIDLNNILVYHRGTLITDNIYFFNNPQEAQLIYQNKLCGGDYTISFLFDPQYTGTDTIYNANLFEIGHLKLTVSQTKETTILSCNLSEKLQLELKNDSMYLIIFKVSEKLHTCDISSSLYTHRDNIPLYMLTNHHYFFDIDNRNEVIGKWTTEFILNNAQEVVMNGVYGMIGNIKVFDVYNDNISELLHQYPTNKNLIINDTARPLIGLMGETQK